MTIFHFQPLTVIFFFPSYSSHLVESLTLDSSRFSYVGVALSREHAIPWIAHIKKLLWHSCLYLDQVSPEFAPDSRSLLLHLRTLVAFTSTTSWALLKAPNMERLIPGMNQLCANVMGHLFSKGFYKTLQVQYFFSIVLYFSAVICMFYR